MTTTANNNERKEFVNKIGFSGSFYKFLGEDIKIGNQILYPGDYQIILDDECKNGHLTFLFTGSIKIKKGNGCYYTLISGAIGNIITYFKPELSMMDIFVELFAIAKVYFEELFKNADPGTYTIKESSKFSGNYFYRFVNVLKCLDDWNGNLYFDNLLSFETKVADICFCIYSCDTNKYFDKYSIVTIKPDKLTKIKRGKPIAQYTDDMLELVSLDLSSMTYVVNGDIGTVKNIQSIVLYDEIGKIVVSCDDGEKIEYQFDGESILQSVLKEI